MKPKEKYAQNIEAAIKIMGKEPVNPIGSCFDSAFMQFLFAESADKYPKRKLCHGIGIASLPGSTGKEMAHAWIEFDEYALDTTWMLMIPIEKYRSDLQLRHVVEYTPAEALFLGKTSDRSGPWDPKILEISNKFEGYYEP